MVGLFGLFLACGGLQAGQDAVIKTMQDELARSMESLRMEELDKTYFVAYRVNEVVTTIRAAAESGSLLGRDENRRRTHDVEVRVGGCALDNTNLMLLSMSGSGDLHRAPDGVPLLLEADCREIRPLIWLATDAAYKQALEDLSKTEAVLQNKTRTDEVPDFSKEKAVRISAAQPAELPDLDKAALLVSKLSGLFCKMRGVSVSGVTLTARPGGAVRRIILARARLPRWGSSQFFPGS